MPPGPGDVWIVRSAGPRVPCQGNIYRFRSYGAREDAKSAHRFQEFLRARPNPAAGRVLLSYSISKPSAVEVKVYDVAGRVVSELFRGRATEGVHTLAWQGRDSAGRKLPSGVYFVTLKIDGEQVKTTRLVLVK